MRRSGPPALHFLAMGVALFTLERVAIPRRPPGPPPPPAAPLLTPDRLLQLRVDFTRQEGVPPTPDEEQALAAQATDDEILYREALVRGLDRDDRSIRYRLAEKKIGRASCRERVEVSVGAESLKKKKEEATDEDEHRT